MRVLKTVILILIVAYPDDVLSERRGRRTDGDKKVDNGPCGKRFMRQINDKCYYLAGKKMNWFGAQNNCLRKGLNLADLSTADEFNAIVKFLRTKGNMEDFWFGGNDLQTEGRFTYISSGRPVRYLGGIDAIEPTHRSNLDDCLEIRLRENTTMVTDDNCQEQQYFICQQNEVKCAQPVLDETTGVHHSHEHLHHFHHDTGKGEISEKESKESLESDSRPADNSKSKEIGESPKAGSKDGEEEETEGAEGEDIGEAESPVETTETGATETTVGNEEAATTAEEAVRLPPSEGESTLQPEGQTTTTVESETADPAENEETTLTTEGVETTLTTNEIDGTSPPDVGEAAVTEPPADDEIAGRAPKASPVSVDIGASSQAEATEKSSASERGSASQLNEA